MSRRTAGALLIVTSAILYGSRYLTAAIYASSSMGWDRNLFKAMLEYVGPGLVTWSIIALTAGILYLVWAEIEAFQRSRSS
jgi:hypothetical protein